ncbi:hypothetical protein GCM10007389_28710 [Pontibacter akesuensis]|nr:hypothetical protein GCM10007389_28710 [Pontibacter akesuensis]
MVTVGISSEALIYTFGATKRSVEDAAVTRYMNKLFQLAAQLNGAIYSDCNYLDYATKAKSPFEGGRGMFYFCG